MRYEDSENYEEEEELEPEEIEIPIQRYRVSMIFSDVENGIEVDGTVKFEMEVEIPRYPEDLEHAAEKMAFFRIENSETGYGHREKPLLNLEIDTMEKIDQYKT